MNLGHEICVSKDLQTHLNRTSDLAAVLGRISDNIISDGRVAIEGTSLSRLGLWIGCSLFG